MSDKIIIREREEYDDAPSLSGIDADIARRINYCGSEVASIDGSIRIMVVSMLHRFGLNADPDKIGIKIVVEDAEENFTFPDERSYPIDFPGITHHLFQQQAAVHSSQRNGDRTLCFDRGNYHPAANAKGFSLEICQRPEEDK